MICPEERRLTAKDVLNHKFITKHTNNQLDQDSKDLTDAKIKNMKEYTHSTTLQRMIYTAVAQRLSYNEIEELEKVFNHMDVNNDGVITMEEFNNGAKSLNISDKHSELKDVFSLIDTDKNKKINYSEFIAACTDKKFLTSRNKLLEIFNNFDENKDGKISKEEFQRVSEMEGIDNETFEGLKKEFQEADENNDGSIDYEEFVRYFTKRKENLLPQKQSSGW